MDCLGQIGQQETMFAKLYNQIFDSSIAEDHEVRHMFMDLVVLADRDGVVDMTLEAISRRTNVPLEKVARCVRILCESDPQSRSHEESGARLKLVDSHRDWGWQIVNFVHYRELRDEDARREYFRDQKRRQRAMSKTVQDSPQLSTAVQLGPPNSTYIEAEAEADLSTHTEESVRGSGDLLTRVMALYGRDAKRRPSRREESIAACIVQRPGWLVELALLEVYRAQLIAAGEGRYFPNSVASLLGKWDETLDRARQRNAAKPKSDVDRIAEQAAVDVPEHLDD